MKPQLASYWRTNTVTPTIKIQQKRSWIGEKKKIGKITVRIDTSNINIFLSLFSLLMAFLERKCSIPGILQLLEVAP